MSDPARKEGESAAKAAGNRGKGRKPGVPNKMTSAMKEMALAALDDLGGKDYMVKVGKSHPAVFFAYLGRFVPSEIKAELTGAGGAALFTPDQLRRVADEMEKPE